MRSITEAAITVGTAFIFASRPPIQVDIEYRPRGPVALEKRSETAFEPSESAEYGLFLGQEPDARSLYERILEHLSRKGQHASIDMVWVLHGRCIEGSPYLPLPVNPDIIYSCVPAVYLDRRRPQDPPLIEEVYTGSGGDPVLGKWTSSWEGVSKKRRQRVHRPNVHQQSYGAVQGKSVSFHRRIGH